jgi:hypothetical protein
VGGSGAGTLCFALLLGGAHLEPLEVRRDARVDHLRSARRRVVGGCGVCVQHATSHAADGGTARGQTFHSARK